MWRRSRRCRRPNHPSSGDPVRRTPDYSPSLLRHIAPSRPVRCAPTPPVTERLDDGAGSANPKICAWLCSRWHCPRVLPQGTEQIKSRADRGRCSFSPLDPRRRSSFSSMLRYPNAAPSRLRPRCPDAAPTRLMTRPTTARILTGGIVLQPDLDGRDRVGTGSRRRMASEIMFPLLQSCRG
jgi:hypothetical protein